jgi:hypothetical protein
VAEGQLSGKGRRRRSSRVVEEVLIKAYLDEKSIGN